MNVKKYYLYLRLRLSNLNILINRWVDSHIIDYPTPIKQILYFLLCVFYLVIISPLWGIWCLLLNTIYLLYYKKYKETLLIWGWFFFIWYFIFIFCMYDYTGGEIVIRPDFLQSCLECEDTIRLCIFLELKYSDIMNPESFFKPRLLSFCMETLGLLGIYSYITDVTIYVPSLLEIILNIFHVLVLIWHILKDIFGR